MYNTISLQGELVIIWSAVEAHLYVRIKTQTELRSLSSAANVPSAPATCHDGG